MKHSRHSDTKLGHSKQC